MKIKVNELILKVSQQYPYNYRVEVRADALASDKVTEWLNENAIPHCQIGWGVFYLEKKYVEWLLLRWS